ncbi:MAG TPA: hypothetical protein VGU03_07790 [Frateuria sp.]|uniref:hypothetical protein n=1 Tax=Frateuria sp. TaxID=2211372 RepID=UPI002DE28DCC|nr:hypothetical protein [Frateuria sp.]
MLLAAALFASAASAAAPAGGVVVPTLYQAGHFYAVPRTADGQSLKLLVDTGGGGSGGMYWLTQAAATRLQLKTGTCKLGGEPVAVAQPPAYKSGRGLPPPLPGPCGTALMINGGSYDVDGQLGAGYLPGRVWTFDYPARRLTLEGAGWHPDPASHSTALGFQRNAKGELASGFARITLRVDGQPLDMLLDTGATAHPTAAGEKASGTPTVGGYGVASYITTSMLEHWRRAHPDWRVVDKGDDLFGAQRATRLIEVPRVGVAGWSAGPVWFTERPDHAFHVFMSSMMDKPVEGAVGGNVLGHFTMTIDYPGAKAYFRCVTGCTASP